MLRKILLAACLTVPLAGYADEKKPTPQQEKMAACNKQAGEQNLKGDARKEFMSKCLSAAKPTQQDKMAICNKQAGEKNLKGDERKAFMSQCLKA